MIALNVTMSYKMVSKVVIISDDAAFGSEMTSCKEKKCTHIKKSVNTLTFVNFVDVQIISRSVTLFFYDSFLDLV